jgi:hypothetical protein
MTIVVSNQIAAAIGIALFAFAANAEPVASGTQSPVMQVRDILLALNLSSARRGCEAASISTRRADRVFSSAREKP